MSIQSKLTKLEKKFETSFPSPKPDDGKPFKVWARFLRDKARRMRQHSVEKNIPPLVIPEEVKPTHADFDAFYKWIVTDTVKERGPEVEKDQIKWAEEVRQIIDKLHAWKD